MVSLKFGPTTSKKGFTSLETSSFNDAPPARIVRELIQNSLDAAVEAKEPTAVVRFRIEHVGQNDIPGIKDYRSAVTAATKLLEGKRRRQAFRRRAGSGRSNGSRVE